VSEIAEDLAGLYLFRNVELQHLEALVKRAPPVAFLDGDVVFRQGAVADTALLVVTGKLVAYVDFSGDHRVLGDSRAGEIVGETALFTRDGTRNATVYADGLTHCLELSRKTLTLVARNPAMVALEQHMMGTMARRIRATNLNIQRVWKEAETARAQAAKNAKGPTLRERLAALFGSGR
jgi:CRP-like cAMP-binding protein